MKLASIDCISLFVNILIADQFHLLKIKCNIIAAGAAI
jgi:hypothetical protein